MPLLAVLVETRAVVDDDALPITLSTLVGHYEMHRCGRKRAEAV